MIQSRKRNDPPPRPVTFTAAEDLNPFELAELWADRMAWPVDGRTPYDELAELAVMSALASGCSVGSQSPFTARCSPAPGRTPLLAHSEKPRRRVPALARVGHPATRPRSRHQAGITQGEYEAVAQRFAAAGVHLASRNLKRERAMTSEHRTTSVNAQQRRPRAGAKAGDRPLAVSVCIAGRYGPLGETKHVRA